MSSIRSPLTGSSFVPPPPATDAEIDQVHANVLGAFKKGKSKSYKFRIEQLKGIRRFLVENEQEIIDAVHHDLHRSKFEAVVGEIIPAITEIDYFIENLSSWMEPEYTPVPALFAPGQSQIVREPFGSVLVLGAFNYPVTLTISPLLGAIAAGNCAVIKPSEMSTAVEGLLKEKLPKYLDKDCYSVVCGDVPATQKLLGLRWDKIFFTGSTRVGRIVMKAAANFLTPVSLELGGKSPTIVDEHVGDMEVAVNRILWGKCVNLGQTCIAPDYAFIHEKHYDEFLHKMKQRIEEFYGKNPQDSPDLGRIVSNAHFHRLHNMLQDCKENIYCGGQTDEQDKYIAPTLITEPSKSAKVMSEEIFGPLLPIFKYKDLNEVVEYINAGEKPLTLYVFTRDKRVVDRLIRDVSSGSLVQNDTLFQFANVYAPFGGVGESGMGGYHGKHSFDCFSHKRSVLLRDDHALLDVPIRYPPYNERSLSILRFLARAPALPVFRPKKLVTVAAALGIVAVAVASLVARGPPENWF